jgi:hypothetical protein
MRESLMPFLFLEILSILLILSETPLPLLFLQSYRLAISGVPRAACQKRRIYTVLGPGRNS